MAVKVLIPTALRQYAGNNDTVSVEASNVGEALSSLTSQYPDLKKHLFNNEGKLRNFVNVYVNDDDIRYLSQESTPLKEADVISIVPSIAGGTDNWRR